MFAKTTFLAFALMALFGAGLLLGACHATAGAGEDISKAGDAITKSADEHTP